MKEGSDWEESPAQWEPRDWTWVVLTELKITKLVEYVT